MVLLLAETTTPDRPGNRGTQAGISIPQQNNIRLPRKPERQIIPPELASGSVNARVWSTSNNDCALQAPGSDSNDQDSRRRKDNNKVRQPEAIILTVNTGIRPLNVSPQLTAQGTLVGPGSEHNKAVNNTGTGGRPRLLNTQQVHAKLTHLPPDESRTASNELAT